MFEIAASQGQEEGIRMFEWILGWAKLLGWETWAKIILGWAKYYGKKIYM